MKLKSTRLGAVVASALMATLPLGASAGPIEDMQRQIDTLQKQLQQMRDQMQVQKHAPATSQDLAKEVAELKKEVKSAGEWKQQNTLIHFAGYADMGYTDTEGAKGTFSPFSFNPILHYQYKDLVLLESELSYSLGADGETELELEYAAINLFLNDYMALVAGKFQSPIGQFRQNGHPSWINKLPSAPVGFGHGGAAPLAEVGLALRGGAPLGSSGNSVNYAVYVGNGPALHIEEEDGEFEVEEIESGGFGADRDGSKVWGGRVGMYVPSLKLDLGVSGATGKVAGLDEVDVKRDYDVYGADFAWRPAKFDFRGEYVQQKVSDAAASIASEGGKWEAWFVQGSYRLGDKFEPVVRYSEIKTPHESQNQEQWALGINYLFTSSVIGKLGYELNDGSDGTPADDDRLLVQLTYGY